MNFLKPMLFSLLFIAGAAQAFAAQSVQAFVKCDAKTHQAGAEVYSLIFDRAEIDASDLATKYGLRASVVGSDLVIEHTNSTEAGVVLGKLVNPNRSCGSLGGGVSLDLDATDAAAIISISQVRGGCIAVGEGEDLAQADTTVRILTGDNQNWANFTFHDAIAYTNDDCQ